MSGYNKKVDERDSTKEGSTIPADQTSLGEIDF